VEDGFPTRAVGIEKARVDRRHGVTEAHRRRDVELLHFGVEKTGRRLEEMEENDDDDTSDLRGKQFFRHGSSIVSGAESVWTIGRNSLSQSRILSHDGANDSPSTLYGI